jgi:mannose-1-phosphate guanylyltransferase
MVILPADHAVSCEESLRETLSEAVQVAEKERAIVTIGIQPSSAHTGYGYIKRGRSLKGNAYRIDRFFEKPNLERARNYLESGRYFWNSGMFVCHAEAMYAALQEHMPQLGAGLARIEQAWGAPNQESTIQEVFEGLESISLDFGVLEHVRNAVVVAAKPFGWNDVGSWDAWAEHFDKDAQGNLFRGNALAIGSRNCVVHGDSRLIAVVGAEDLVVIDSGDALLVCPRERLQDVRLVVQELKKQGRTDLI